MRLILASASRGRKMLMEEWGVPFEVLVSDVEEPIDGYDNPRTFVQEVAFSKAKAVAERISDGIIVAAGQAVGAAATILGDDTSLPITGDMRTLESYTRLLLSEDPAAVGAATTTAVANGTSGGRWD